MMNRADPFLQARDLLLKHRDRHAEAVRDFRWPRLELFNWALDYFDQLALVVLRAQQALPQKTLLEHALAELHVLRADALHGPADRECRSDDRAG